MISQRGLVGGDMFSGNRDGMFPYFRGQDTEICGENLRSSSHHLAPTSKSPSALRRGLWEAVS